MMDLSHIDFRHGSRTPLRGWALLTLALTVAVTSWRWRDQQEGVREQAAASAGRQVHAQQSNDARQVAARQANLMAQRRQTSYVQAMQGRPWLAALSAVELAIDVPNGGVYLLSLTIDGNLGRIQLEGQADHLDALNALVQRLATSPVLSGVQLESHEPVSDAGPAGNAQRFQALTRWVQR